MKKAIKIINVVGARPQFIKYFLISKAIKEYNELPAKFPPFLTCPDREIIEDILIHTGQHYDYKLSEVFFNEFGISQPKYHLGIGSLSHGAQTGQILQKVEEALLQEKPDILVVYGDTNSALGGALAAVKLHIPVAHVEAGLRSYNKNMPEEINRVLIDHVSSILFCPTETAVKNLQKEGMNNIVNRGKLIGKNFNALSLKFHDSRPLVVNTGDVMHDLLLFAIKAADRKSRVLRELNIVKKKYCILTLHRAENTDDRARLGEIIDFINNASKGYTVIFPVHPRAKKAFANTRKKFSDNVKMIEPVSYFEMVKLLKESALIFTDSGGLQKEAFWLKVPCVTLRDETEWVETIQSGWNVLYKYYKGRHKITGKPRPLSGNAEAARKITGILIKSIKEKRDEY